MAISRVLNTLLPNFNAVDVVGVFTQDFTQIFTQARPIKALIREDSKVMEHPVETGVITTDHRIILPTEIELSMILNSANFKDVYRQIKGYWNNGTLLLVQTNAGVYPNQLIQSLPHEESPDQFGTLTMSLKLKQVLIVSAAYDVVPTNPKHTTTVPTGTQQPQTGGWPPGTTKAQMDAWIGSDTGAGA